MKFNKILAVSMAALLGVSASFAQAAEVTSGVYNFGWIVPACHVNGTKIDFGEQDATLPDDYAGESPIQVKCTNKIDYKVGLRGGASGDVKNRLLINYSAGFKSSYALYTDAGHTDIWGDDTGASLVTGTGTGEFVDIPVYGLWTVTSDMPVGYYEDKLEVVVWY